MPNAEVSAVMYRSPRKYVSDGKFTPEGTIQFQHTLSIEGEGARFYCDADLTGGLNGSRAKLDKGEAVPVVATVRLGVQGRKLVAAELLSIAEPTKG